MSDVYYVLVRKIEDHAELDALRVELALTSGLTERSTTLADRGRRYLADHDRADVS